MRSRPTLELTTSDGETFPVNPRLLRPCIALTKAAPNKENAIKLMEFLAGETAQEMYAELNNEYPVRPGVEWSPLLKSWGEFKTDDLSLSAIAELAPKAQKLVDEVGYNE